MASIRWLSLSFQMSACYRPPEPTTRIFIDARYTTGAHDPDVQVSRPMSSGPQEKEAFLIDKRHPALRRASGESQVSSCQPPVRDSPPSAVLEVVSLAAREVTPLQIVPLALAHGLRAI